MSQGLARVDSNGAWRIYSEGHDIIYEVNGQCVVAGETRLCMWHAIAFEFFANAESSSLTCKATFASKRDVVNPEAVQGSQIKEFSFTTELKGRAGKVIWPGYIIGDGLPGTSRTSVSCFYEGTEVLRYSYSVTERPD